MKSISAFTMALSLVASALYPANSAQASVKFANSLYRCTMNNKATLCFSASSTPASLDESCQIVQLKTALNRVSGGGLVFTLSTNPESQETKNGQAKCADNIIVVAGYLGFVKPCAPGGPEDWQHVSRHVVNWTIDALLAGQNDQDQNVTRTYPLRVSTCTGGGGQP